VILRKERELTGSRFLGKYFLPKNE
jgi:hypothetical protein